MQHQSIEGLTLLLLVLVSLLVKHFFADFPLQTKYMLRKGNVNGWLKPLLAHCGLHGVLTFVVLLPLVGWCALLFGLADFVLHFCIDFWKSRFAKYKPFDKKFWTALGIDQLAHNLTYVAMAFFALASYC